MPEIAVTLWVATAGGLLSIALAIAVAVWVHTTRGSSRVAAEAPWLLRAPLLPLVLAVVSGLVAVYSLILHFAFGAVDFQLPEKANIASPILVAATLVAGTLTAAFAVLKLRAHLITEAKGELDANSELRAGERHRNDQEAALSERFAGAVALLADQQPISRIAGAHLVFAIGDEWKNIGAQQRCFDVLLSHLRGLNRSESFEDVAESQASREEVRLITGELLRRLGEGHSAWAVTAGDFSGAVVADFDFAGVAKLDRLDLSGAHVLGDLSIPVKASESAPILAGLLCEGNLTVQSDPDWGETRGRALDLSDAEVAGSVILTGSSGKSVLTGDLIASGLVVRRDLGLDFDLFLGDVILDSASITGLVMVGSPERGAFYGTVTEAGEEPERKPTRVSAVGTIFREFRLRRSEQGPRLDLTDAEGGVDLSGSTFYVEVTANNLNASDGLQIKDASFNSLFVLDGATTPNKVDLDGVYFSKSAKGAFRSSDFALRDQLLAHGVEAKPERVFRHDAEFDWKSAIAPYLEQCSPELIDDLEERLSLLETSLPVDWNTRTTFTAQVMSAVSRAVAKTDASQGVEDTLQRALRDSLPLMSDEQER